MFRFAIIENGEIKNIIVADQEFINIHYPDAIIAADFVGVGDRYENGEFIKVEVLADDLAAQ